MSYYTYPPPPPPPPSSSATITILQPQYTDNGGAAAEIINNNNDSSQQSPSSSIVIIIIVIASAIIVSASIYILLRFFSRRHHHHRRQSSFRSISTPDEEALSRNNNRNINDRSVFDSLPMFNFSSVAGNVTSGGGGDCAVCLSKFEAEDQLRLLPLCCHAFHAQCIDTWLASSLTCPLCRSSVFAAADSAELPKIILEERINSRNGNGNGSETGAAGGRDHSSAGGSFRIEIGSISRRHGGGTDSGRRSYSVGSFEYIIDEGYEVSIDSTHQRDHNHHHSVSIDKDLHLPVHMEAAPPGESLAREVSGRSWLREYFDRIGSLSFRSSGRFNSRHSEVVVPVEEEMEEHRAGEEISELFRWLSGV